MRIPPGLEYIAKDLKALADDGMRVLRHAYRDAVYLHFNVGLDNYARLDVDMDRLGVDRMAELHSDMKDVVTALKNFHAKWARP